jgi:hypothetical protein
VAGNNYPAESLEEVQGPLGYRHTLGSVFGMECKRVVGTQPSVRGRRAGRELIATAQQTQYGPLQRNSE